jgi:hypothetical protein
MYVYINTHTQDEMLLYVVADAPQNAFHMYTRTACTYATCRYVPCRKLLGAADALQSAVDEYAQTIAQFLRFLHAVCRKENRACMSHIASE